MRGFTTSPTLASPILHAVSGSNFKHTDPADLALLTPIAVTTSNIRLVKSVSPTTLPSGGNATYTVHVTNPASNAGCPVGSPNCNDVQLDDVVDVLPTSPGVGTYVAGTSKLDGVTINVHFDLNADTISTTSAGVLDSVAAVMQAVPQIHATLIGHTDPRGSVAYNLALGRRRAHAVYFFLIAAGVDSSRLSFGSEGKAAPVAIGNGVREHALNRRVEIQYSGPSGVQLEVHHQERDLQLERSRKPAAQGSAAQRKRTAIRKRATALAP